MTGMIRVSISLILLILLSGCFGATMFQIGPIPIKTGDILTKPITKSMVDKDTKMCYIIDYDNKRRYKNTYTT